MDFCECPDASGGTFCETEICQNGGTFVGPGCICGADFGGTFCQTRTSILD
jgi:hypothetical protein